MKKSGLLILSAIGALVLLCGCQSTPSSHRAAATGFLSDYSQLETTVDGSRRYTNPKYDLRDYAKFIVEPVELFFDEETEAEVGDWDQLQRLRAHMRNTLINTLEPRYAAVGTKPEPGTARIRVALTGVKKGKPFAMGGASMEAELTDSQTGEQIAALIETQRVRKAYGALSPWDDAKAAMDSWARRLYDRLEGARGR